MREKQLESIHFVLLFVRDSGFWHFVDYCHVFPEADLLLLSDFCMFPGFCASAECFWILCCMC